MKNSFNGDEIMKKVVRGMIALAVLLMPALGYGAIPVSGRPVPSMVIFDRLMTNYMTTNQIEAGVLGIMRDGKIVYVRGFGYLDTNVALPENAMFRVASLSKAPTAAAIRMLANDGVFGAQGIDRPAYRLTVNNVNNGGVLDIAPWRSLGDTDFAAITVRNLLDHTSGLWELDRDQRGVAAALGIPSPPTRTDLIRYMLNKQVPGTNGQFNYSNFGYITLAEILSRNCPGGYLQCIRERVMTPEIWIPSTEVVQAQSLREAHDPREPWYRAPGDISDSVYDNVPPIDRVPTAYGGFDMEAVAGAGSLLASAQAMLIFASRFHLWYPNAGVPTTPAFPADGSVHDGGTSGLNTRLQARGDGIVIYLAFNKVNTVQAIFDQVSATINNGQGTQFAWPDTTSDGFWVTLGAENSTSGFGGYHSPFQGFASALGRTTDGSRLRLKAGSTTWHGRISKRVRLDAPEGAARIGG